LGTEDSEKHAEPRNNGEHGIPLGCCGHPGGIFLLNGISEKKKSKRTLKRKRKRQEIL